MALLPRPSAHHPARWLAALALVLLSACGRDGTRPENPVPRIESLSLSGIERGAAAEPLIVRGVGFTRASLIRIHGEDRPTQYVSDSELRTTLRDGDARLPGAIRVTVYTPPPGGGISHAATIAIISPLITLGQMIEGDLPEPEIGVEEFRIVGEAGAEVVVLARGSGGTMEVVLADSAAHEPIARAMPYTYDELAEQWASARVVLPRSGTHLVHVIYRGPVTYQVRVDALNRAPEESPASLDPGVVVSEAIGSIGDIDEFTFTGRAGEEVSLVAQLVSGMSGGLTLEVLRGTQVLRRLELHTPTETLDEVGTGRFALPADGAYRVRAYAAERGTLDSATGRYRLEFYRVDRRPEGGSELRLDGPPVHEAIDRPGDVDEFRFAGRAGQLVVIHLDGEAPARGVLVADLLDDDENLLAAAAMGDYPPAGQRYSYRRELPRDGTYTVRVRDALPSTAVGPYTLEAYTIDPRPEHVPERIEIGQTVTQELIDRPGDLDVYTLVGEAGREIIIFLSASGIRLQPYAILRKLGDTGPPRIMTYPGTPSLDGRSTGRITLEDTTYLLTVDPHFGASGGFTGFQGSYGLRVFPVDRRPEGRPAEYVLGDTVADEPIYPAGDIDEYTFELHEQTDVHVFWERGTGPDAGVLGNLIDDETGKSIWNNYGVPSGDLTLPAGRYRMSVSNPSIWGDTPMTHYRFAVLRR